MQQSVKSDIASAHGFSGFQTWILVILRILVGWHFFYEGLAKLLNEYWSSAGYLGASQWWFSGFFVGLASNSTTLAIVDVINSWGLLLIGLGLMLGLFTRSVTIAAIVLLFLYYIAAPPFPGYSYAIPMEGSYLIVNKVLLELCAAFVLLAFPTGKAYGLDGLIPWKKTQALKQANA